MVACGTVILKNFTKFTGNTAQKTKISTNFLVQKFCGNAQFPQSFGRIVRNSADTGHFRKISTPGT